MFRPFVRREDEVVRVLPELTSDAECDAEVAEILFWRESWQKSYDEFVVEEMSSDEDYVYEEEELTYDEDLSDYADSGKDRELKCREEELDKQPIVC